MGHFFGLELYDGHLFLHLDMGTGHIKIRVSGPGGGVSDGKWHAFHMERTKQFGKVTLDGKGNDFAIPGNGKHLTISLLTPVAGEPSRLMLSEPLYLGGMPPLASPPPELWSQGGLVGCVRDLVINGLSVQLGEVARSVNMRIDTNNIRTMIYRNQDPGSVRPGCQRQGDQCTVGSQGGPCHNGGQCTQGWNRFICDCTLTNFTGPTCARGE